jgi:MoaA/NifB/PqqE/SkfB family radical SAM enzyme
MIAYEQIRDVHLEISTLCNASCAWCPRTFWGYPYNGGYPEIYITREQAQQMLPEDFVGQLTSLRINGNFGDIVMNPEGPDVVEYLRQCNTNLMITINTNGAARDPEFWERLAKSRAQVWFAIDGLEDTHHLYRQNTVWATVMRNAKTFIAAGGRAVWTMIQFQHNQHQIADCRKMSQDLGFVSFRLRNDGRDTGPVFDRQGQLIHVMGDYKGETSFPVLFQRKQTDQVLLEDITEDRRPKKTVTCETKLMKSIYIAANGDVSPCCYTGLYPATYGHGQYHQAANSQLVPLIAKNNALKWPLHECIQWFSEIERRWSRDSYQSGRLVICDDHCGSD